MVFPSFISRHARWFRWTWGFSPPSKYFARARLLLPSWEQHMKNTVLRPTYRFPPLQLSVPDLTSQFHLIGPGALFCTLASTPACLHWEEKLNFLFAFSSLFSLFGFSGVQVKSRAFGCSFTVAFCSLLKTA